MSQQQNLAAQESNECHVKKPMTEREVSEPEERHEFLYKHLNKVFIFGEQFVYAWMNKYAQTYNGGFWNFIEVSNDAFYMKPENSYLVELPNCFSDELTDKECGIVVTLYMLSDMAARTYAGECCAISDFLSKKYHKLRDYVCQLPQKEQNKIFSAID
ncbi:antirestriction protein [Morganella psychrotolerans]|uniref:antirestriction protein n=1 Tax=Morganella psychrotolerans TaxID=368603 RepID=UPI0039AF21A8